jgi:hypothetical protein
LPLQKERGDGIRSVAGVSGEWARVITLRRRLAVWSAVAVAAALAVRLEPMLHLEVARALVTLLLALCSCTALAGGVFYFVTFVVTRRLSELLESTAFVAIGCGAAIQVVLNLAAVRASADDRLGTMALLCGATALCIAAYSHAEWRPATKAGGWLQLTLAALLVCAFPLAVFPSACECVLVSMSASTYATAGLVCPIASVLLLLAIRGYWKQHQDAGDRRCAVDCYFIPPLALACIFRAFSVAPNDVFSEYSHFLFIGGWFVFLAVVSTEQALSARESSDRIRELNTLQDVSWSLVGATSVDDLLQRLADKLRSRFDAEIVMAHVVADSRDVLRVAAVSGPDEVADRRGTLNHLNGPDFRPGFHTGHTARAFKTCSVQTAIDVAIDVELVPWRVLARGNGCAISLPLVGDTGPVGVVGIYFPDCMQMTREQRSILQAVVAAVSPAIATALSPAVSSESDDGLDIAA